jgi:tRNA pseudouridine13 synthase
VIPKIDSDIGISLYATKSVGTGGIIKKSNDDFKVKELLSEKALTTISNGNGFSVYILKKNGIDTSHALRDVEKRFGLVLKSLGLKDANAVTEQYVFSKTISKSFETIQGKNYSLKRLGFVKKPLSKKDMIGNHFEIKVENPLKHISNFNENEKILNFFGYQRFGSKRPITHLVGKAIIQKDYQAALDLLLNYSSHYDTEENNTNRKIIAERTSELSVIDKIPKSMDIEIILLKKLSETKDLKIVIRSIPLHMRRFYIQAYQSYIYNKTLSLAFDYGEELFSAKEGDVCFDRNYILGKFQNDPSQMLSIPLVGHSYFKKTRFDFYIQKILNEEEVSLNDFFIKDFQEISIEGGFRNAIIQCNNFEINDNIIKFDLSRGSYATIILREILKPDNPLKSGF